jgi:hypothetical protein
MQEKETNMDVIDNYNDALQSLYDAVGFVED